MPNVVQRRVALLSDDGKFADSMTPQAVLDAVEHVDQAVADIEGDLAEMLAKSANLSDVPSPAAARANLGAAAADHTHTPEQVIGLAAALDAKADLVNGVIPTSQIPREAMGDTVVVASQAEMLALTTAQVQPGDIAIRTDGAGSFILKDADPSQLGSWVRLNSPTDAVTSVNGQIGDVTLSAANVGAATPQQVSDAVGAVEITAAGYAAQAAGSATAAANSASAAASARADAVTARDAALGAQGLAEDARDAALAAAAYRKHPTGLLALTQRSADRSLGTMNIRTWETPVGVAYGMDHGWLAKTTDGWDTKTNSPFNSGQEPLRSLGGEPIAMAAWSDGSFCLIGNTRILTMDSFTSAPVVRLESAKRFSIAHSFYESGGQRIVLAGEYNQADLSSKRLYLSRDGGLTFSVVRQTVDGAGPVNNHWHATAYDPWGGALWASAGDDTKPPRELSFSLDWGVTWSSLTAPADRHLQPTAIMPFPARMVFGRDSGGFAPGLDWWERPVSGGQPEGGQALAPGLMTFAPDLSAAQVYPDASTWCIGRNSDECYILFPPRGTGRGAIYATGDGGRSWHRVADVTRAGSWSLASDGVRVILAKVNPAREVWSAPLLTWDWTA